MTPDALRGMRVELMKRAGVAGTLARYARPLVMRAGALPGGVAGAGLGAGLNVAREAVSGGEDYGGAALRGAAGGALLGAGAGFGVGKARDIALTTGKRGLSLAKEMGKRTVKSVGDFGKRQVHGTTGWTPKAGPESIGLAGGVQKNRQKVVKAMRDARLRSAKSGREKYKIVQKSNQQLAALKKQEKAMREAYDAGLTSIPGTVKGLVKDPKRVGKAAWRSVKEHPGGVLGAAALPAALTAGEIASGTDPSEAVGGGVGDVAGMALTGAMPIVPGMAAWTALSEAGRFAGRKAGGKKKRGKTLKEKAMSAAPSVSPPTPSTPVVQPTAEEAVQ